LLYAFSGKIDKLAIMKPKAAANIAKELEELIFDGSFADGDRLDEVRLAERFGVSRTPIREAFQKLAYSGLLELMPRQGAFVKQPGPIELIEMFEVMSEMEAICARLAAIRISDEALNDLNRANEKCRLAVDADTPDQYYLENEKFHKIIYKQSGNSFLEEETSHLHNRLKPFRRHQLRLRGRMAQSLREHEAVVSALKEGNPEEAANAIRDHVAVQGEKFQNLMAVLKESSKQSA